MKRALVFVLLLVVAAGAFAYGLYVGTVQTGPYKRARAVYREYMKRFGSHLEDPRFTEVADRYKGVDVEALISIRSSADVDTLRQGVIDFIWKGRGFPTGDSLSSVATGIEDRRYADITNLASIDRYRLDMRYGVNSVAYHFRPQQPRERLVVYHQGHLGDFFAGKETVRALVDDGYDVIAFAMPLLGNNSTPTVDLPNRGPVRFYDHHHFYLVESEEFSALTYFMDPIAVTLNYVLARESYGSVYFVGISGGGWTGVLYAALDTRVTRSYPVAHASYPFFLREIHGDYEQFHPQLYRIANYLELFVMGTHPAERRQLQVFNRFDPSCCWGVRYEVYLDPVRAALAQSGGGELDVFLDSTHRKHMISPVVLEEILADMRRAGSS